MGCAVFLFDVVAEAVVGDDAVDGAEVAIFDESADLYAEREEAGPDGFHQEEVLCFSRLDQLLRLSCVGGKGLLAQDMLAGFETEHRVLVMVGMGRGNVDDIYVLVFDELFIRSVGGGTFWNLAFFEELLGSICG